MIACRFVCDSSMDEPHTPGDTLIHQKVPEGNWVKSMAPVWLRFQRTWQKSKRFLHMMTLTCVRRVSLTGAACCFGLRLHGCVDAFPCLSSPCDRGVSFDAGWITNLLSLSLRCINAWDKETGRLPLGVSCDTSSSGMTHVPR